jgi:diketogulonate reductase-like aldo/keto reductase
MGTLDTLRYTTLPLTDGSGAMPALGFGTLIPDLLATKQAITTALEVGFRHFDCAERYRNEQAVGDAMQGMFRAGNIRREDVFVTTKLWNNNHRPERVRPAFEASRQHLQVDYVDCYLIHTPFSFQPGNEQDPRDDHGQVIYDPGVTLVETWQALERTRAGASPSAYLMSVCRRCKASLTPLGSSLLWSKSNPIRISLNGTCSTFVTSTGSCCLHLRR